jgi:hypothetical protein
MITLNAVKVYLLVLVLVVAETSAHAALICTTDQLGAVVKAGKYSEYVALMDKKLFNEAIECCIACIVKPGTKVIITDQGFLSHTIRVLEGKSRGCVGDVAMEVVKDCR